jgi:hypothetical protein
MAVGRVQVRATSHRVPPTTTIRPPLQLLQSDAAVLVTLPLYALWLAFFLPYRDMEHFSHAYQCMLAFLFRPSLPTMDETSQLLQRFVAVAGTTNVPSAASPTGRDAPLCWTHPSKHL